MSTRLTQKIGWHMFRQRRWRRWSTQLVGTRDPERRGLGPSVGSKPEGNSHRLGSRRSAYEGASLRKNHQHRVHRSQARRPRHCSIHASKAAVVSWTQSNALQRAAFDVNVNAICAGETRVKRQRRVFAVDCLLACLDFRLAYPFRREQRHESLQKVIVTRPPCQ